MIEKEVLVIDEKEYFVLNELTYQETNYVYLVGVHNLKDILILKSVYEKEEEYLESLKDEEEFDIVFSLFQNEAQAKAS